MISQGVVADFIEHYIKIGESIVIESLRRFVRAVVRCLEVSTWGLQTTIALLDCFQLKRGGFSEMLGSVDCMHWEWKNCPSTWHGQYTRHAHEPTIIHEVIVSKDLWIWHAFFGLPRSLNDINVRLFLSVSLHQSIEQVSPLAFSYSIVVAAHSCHLGPLSSLYHLVLFLAIPASLANWRIVSGVLLPCTIHGRPISTQVNVRVKHACNMYLY
jgi:hypothetical protein